MDNSYTDLIRGFCDPAWAGIWVLMPAYRPVDTFVTYDGKRAADIPPPRYAVRHLVAAEVSSRRHAAEKPAVVLSHLLLDSID
jgi:hypothetical protein